MHFYENHRLQTIFVLLQAGVIMAGSLATGVILKFAGYVDGMSIGLSPLLSFVRNWGFLLISIPLAWTLLTIALERRTHWYSNRWTMGSGLLVLALLGWLLFYAIGRATMCTLTMSEG